MRIECAKQGSGPVREADLAELNFQRGRESMLDDVRRAIAHKVGSGDSNESESE